MIATFLSKSIFNSFRDRELEENEELQTFPLGWALELVEPPVLLTIFGDQSAWTELEKKNLETCRKQENEKQEELQTILWEQELAELAAHKPLQLDQLQFKSSYSTNELEKKKNKNDQKKNKKLEIKNEFHQSLYFTKLVALLLEKHFASAASSQLLGYEAWEKYREASEDSFDTEWETKNFHKSFEENSLTAKTFGQTASGHFAQPASKRTASQKETFSNTSLGKETFKESSLTTSSFTKSSLTASSLTRSSLTENSFLENTFLKNTFSKKSFDKSSFGKSSLGDSSLETSSLAPSSLALAHSSLKENNLKENSFEESSLAESSLATSTSALSSFLYSSFKENSFEESSFKKSSFSQSSFEERSFGQSRSLEESSLKGSLEQPEGSSFEQSSLEPNSFEESFGHSSFRGTSFQNRSFTDYSFQTDSFQDSSFQEQSFQDRSLNSRASTAELYQLARELPATELSQLEQPAFRTELETAWQKELEKLRAQLAQLCLQRGKLQPSWWAQIFDNLGPRGSAKNAQLPLSQLTSLTLTTLSLVLGHLGSRPSFARASWKRKLAPKLSTIEKMVSAHFLEK